MPGVRERRVTGVTTAADGPNALDDDEALLHTNPDSGAAQVRVVLVRPGPDGLVIPLVGGDPVDLHDDGAADDEEIVGRLIGSSLIVDASEDIPHKVVEALRRSALPALFCASPWLRRARVLVLKDGQARLSGMRVGYRPGVGLWVKPAETVGL